MVTRPRFGGKEPDDNEKLGDSPAGPAFPEGDSRDITPRESGLHANQACASGAWAYTEGAGQKPSAELVGEPLATSAEQGERWFLQGDTDARRLDK